MMQYYFNVINLVLYRINMNWTLLVVVLVVMLSSAIMFIQAAPEASLERDAKCIQIAELCVC